MVLRKKKKETTPMYPWPPYMMPPMPAYGPAPQQQQSFDPLSAIEYFDRIEQFGKTRRKAIEDEIKLNNKDSDEKKKKAGTVDVITVALLLFTLGPWIGLAYKTLFLAVFR